MAPESHPSITSVGNLFWIEPLGKSDLILRKRTLQAKQCHIPAVSGAESMQIQFTTVTSHQLRIPNSHGKHPLPADLTNKGRSLKPAHFVALPKFRASSFCSKHKIKALQKSPRLIHCCKCSQISSPLPTMHFGWEFVSLGTKRPGRCAPCFLLLQPSLPMWQTSRI